MGRGLQATKRRIQSVKTTRKITKAMELVATAKLKTWKDRMVKNSSYTQAMLDLIAGVFASTEDRDSLYLQEGDAAKSLYVVVASTLGLCAGYNYNLLKLADQSIDPDDDILVIGAKGYYHFRHHEGELITDYLTLQGSFDYLSSRKLSDRLLHDFRAGKYRKINLIYTHYRNSLTFVPTLLTLLPISVPTSQEATTYGLIYEPSITAIIESLVPLYVKSTIYGKLIEAMVSEQASRRTAMENATNNADEITEQLLLEYNKERQASITQEITEVVGGAIDK